MSEELKFQKLSEVELVEEASGNAHPLVEEDGKIKRVVGGLGGGSGYPLVELSTTVKFGSEAILSDEDGALLDAAVAKNEGPITISLPIVVSETDGVANAGKAICPWSPVYGFVGDENVAMYVASLAFAIGVLYPPYSIDTELASWVITLFITWIKPEVSV